MSLDDILLLAAALAGIGLSVFLIVRGRLHPFVFFSHVNDPGFWLVRSYLGTSTAGTFRTWSVLETVISVSGLAFVLIGSQLL